MNNNNIENAGYSGKNNRNNSQCCKNSKTSEFCSNRNNSQCCCSSNTEDLGDMQKKVLRSGR